MSQLVETRHVGRHVAIGRHHDGGRPAHDMIAGEQRVAKLIAKMVRGVPRSRNRRQRAAIDHDRFPVRQHPVGRIVEIEAGIGARSDCVDRQCGAADDRRTCRCLERGGGRTVVAMGMSARDRNDRSPGNRREQRLDMVGKSGPGVDHDDLEIADEIALRSGVGEGRRIRRQKARHAGLELLEPSIGLLGKVGGGHEGAPAMDAPGAETLFRGALAFDEGGRRASPG